MIFFGYAIIPAQALTEFREAAENLQEGVHKTNGMIERELFRSLHTMATFVQELQRVVDQTDNPLAKALKTIAEEEAERLSDKIHKLRGRS